MRLDLSPAKWIWLPSERTLPNTVVTFKKDIEIKGVLESAKGWICADSRYRLKVNGNRVQWGPAPCDPRWPEADPIDLSRYIREGTLELQIDVLYYGHGDGTWAMGKPGLIMALQVVDSEGERLVVTDDTWHCRVNRQYKPGSAKRWFLRSLQERFDATEELGEWHPAMVLDTRADMPPFASSYGDYLIESGLTDASTAELRARSIPLMKEQKFAAKLVATGRVKWRDDPRNWFDFRIPVMESITKTKAGALTRSEKIGCGREGVFFLLALEEQMVGWPYFSISGPEGMNIEVITSEAHDPNSQPWLDSGFYNWSSFKADYSISHENFDFESFRWMQIHCWGAPGTVMLGDAGIRRRVFPWKHQPQIQVDEPPLQRLFDASINTLNNCAQETCVDGMARERQQYSGDGSHQLHAIRYAFGAYDLSARFLTTFSQGITPEGYFLDCWPGFDRLARVMEKQIGASYWGPLLDHGVGFVFDSWNHYWETGFKQDLEEPYPRLLRFARYLESLIGKNGLLPVEGMPVTNVYMDHQAYRSQREKQCAFNLYASAMFRHALAPLQELFGDEISTSVEISDALLSATRERFWSEERGAFINNLPWLEDEPHFDDRSLATAVLFDQLPPEHDHGELLSGLVGVGKSYPANAVWRYWALAKLGLIQVVLDDLRGSWATMDSVFLNNTIQEFWTARPDSTDLWSHCAMAPLNSLFMDVMGLRPAAAGFKEFALRPQLGDLTSLKLTAQTPYGPVHFESRGNLIRVDFPETISGVVQLPDGRREPLVSGATFEV